MGSERRRRARARADADGRTVAGAGYTFARPAAAVRPKEQHQLLGNFLGDLHSFPTALLERHGWPALFPSQLPHFSSGGIPLLTSPIRDGLQCIYKPSYNVICTPHS